MPSRSTLHKRNVHKVRWLTAQLDTTSSEICHLLSIGRLSGTKQKDPRRGGTAQWSVNPRCIAKEKNYRAKLAGMPRRPKKVANSKNLEPRRRGRG